VLKSVKNVMLLLILLFLPAIPGNFNRVIQEKYGIVKVIQPDFKSAGTGFHLTNDKNQTFIVTNEHVCKGAVGSEVVIAKNSTITNTKIVKSNKILDLCLLKPTLKGEFKHDISPASDVLPSFATGHGAGYAATTAFGSRREHIITSSCAEIGIDRRNGQPTCLNYKLELLEQFDMTIIKGHSGSPVISVFGKVNGVVTQNNKMGMTFVVNSQILKEFVNQ